MSRYENQLSTEDEKLQGRGIYSIVHDIDNNLHEIKDDLYDFKRLSDGKFSRLEQDAASLKNDLIDLKITTGVTKSELAGLKGDVKELQRDVSELKGEIKELSGNVAAMQTRFNWGLIIIGFLVALVPVAVAVIQGVVGK